MSYRVRLESFEGPLDLLLFFIRRDEIDIMDIPIARITAEYLSYLADAQTLNLVLAGEFVVMAATLMRIKARMLLPAPVEGEEMVEDPRTVLVQRLLDYQRYKEAAEALRERGILQERKYPKGATDVAYADANADAGYLLERISLYDLGKIFRDLLHRVPLAVSYETKKEEVHVKEQIAFLLARLWEKPRMLFAELVSVLRTRLHIVTTFIAMLELARSRQIHLSQKEPFGALALERVES